MMQRSRKTLLISTWTGRVFLLFWLAGAVALLGRGLFELCKDREEKTIVCHGRDYDYLLLFPRDYATSDPPRPLLVFLHGAGELGKDISSLRQANPVYYCNKVTRDNFPFLVACPQGDGPVWEPDRVVGFIDELTSGHFGRRAIDPARIYLTGFSLGGYGTWQTAALYPDRFAAVVPVAGDCNPVWSERYGDLPIWAFHGELDRIVPPDGCVETIEILQRERSDPDITRSTFYPDAEHGIARESYGSDELYRWLLRYRIRKE